MGQLRKFLKSLSVFSGNSCFANAFAGVERTVFRGHEPGFEAGSVATVAAGEAQYPVATVAEEMDKDSAVNEELTTFSGNALDRKL